MDIRMYQLISLIGLLLGGYGIYRRYKQTRRRALPKDQSPAKGDPRQGIAYAFTLGMAPWAKESTRIHLIAYLRGIGFHVGIFSAIGFLFISPFLEQIPPLPKTMLAWTMVMGSVLGAAGGLMRILEHNLRALSIPDDHFAVWLVTIWLSVSAMSIWDHNLLAVYYVISAITLAYIPVGKIRHCLYFFFSRTFFGKFFGRRAVFPHTDPIR